jgi:hypothetical protein
MGYTAMRKQEMSKKVAQELSYIPGNRKNVAQGILRTTYDALRRHDLSVNPAAPASESLRSAIAAVRRNYPKAPLQFDQEFFGLQS